MFSRFRGHFNASTVIATLALVFAMTGGAYAAKHYLITSTKQISPKVLKALKGKAGKTGSAGPQGPAGEKGAGGTNGINGKDGANGLNGKDGANGKSVVVAAAAKCAAGGVSVEVEGSKAPQEVCDGTTGYVDALPKGKTLSGVYGSSGYAPGLFEGATETSVSFPFRVENEAGQGPKVHYIAVGQSAPPGCGSGTHEAPEAEAGNLCIFAAAETNATSAFSPGHPAVCDYTLATNQCVRTPERVSPIGFGLDGVAGGTGVITIRGTWAVTAE